MNDGAPHLPPDLPTWIPFQEPADAHPAAFEAFVHKSERCFLMRFWAAMWNESAGAGVWEWHVVGRDRSGKRRSVCVGLGAAAETDFDVVRLIQSAGEAVEAIGTIARANGEATQHAATIAAAVTEQNQVTMSISKNIQDAADWTAGLASTVEEVASAIARTKAAAEQVDVAAATSASSAEQFNRLVDAFLAKVRAA